MKKIEHFGWAALLGSVIPIALFLAGWWGSLPYMEETAVLHVALAAFGCGTLIELFAFEHLRRMIWQLSAVTLACVFVFYSIGVFGFFMGVPVSNLVVGTLAGRFLGRRWAYQRLMPEQFARHIRQANGFITGILLILCVISAWLAVRDPFTAANLRGMLHLPFTPTTHMIIALILVGGCGLLLLQWICVFRAAKCAFDDRPSIRQEMTR